MEGLPTDNDLLKGIGLLTRVFTIMVNGKDIEMI